MRFAWQTEPRLLLPTQREGVIPYMARGWGGGGGRDGKDKTLQALVAGSEPKSPQT